MSIGLQVWSQTASANSTADTNINWAEGQAPSSVNDSARAMMASNAKWRDDNNGSIVTGGSTTAYTVTSSQVSSGLTAGYTVAFQMHATNDAAATLNVDGLGGKPLQVIAGTNLQGGELQLGNVYRATYSTSGTGQWIVNGAVQPGSQASIIGTANITAAAVTYAKIQNVAASRLLGNPTGGATSVSEISLGTNLSFSGTTLNAGNNTPVVSVFTSTGTATWSTTTQNGNFPLYLLVRMVAGGGGGGANSANAGSSGTDTSFNNWTAVAGGKGGTGGGTAGAGGSGGTNGTGTLLRRIAGGNGSIGQANSNGQGGGTAIAPPTNATASSGQPSAAAANSGAGGAPAPANNSAGGGGGEYVEFIITSPSTSYSYTVGGPGAGGSAGGTAGGNGAAGRVEVISYWQ